MTHPASGTHAILDIMYKPDRGDDLLKILSDACKRNGATVMGSIVQPFEPQGETIVVILAESHAVISTYPEHNVAMIDVFTCGNEIDPTLIADDVAQHLDGVPILSRHFSRGVR